MAVGSVGALYRYDVEAADPDAGDTVTFALTTAPTGMTIDTATGEIGWTPSDTQGGPHDVLRRAGVLDVEPCSGGRR